MTLDALVWFDPDCVACHSELCWACPICTRNDEIYLWQVTWCVGAPRPPCCHPLGEIDAKMQNGVPSCLIKQVHYSFNTCASNK